MKILLEKRVTEVITVNSFLMDTCLRWTPPQDRQQTLVKWENVQNTSQRGQVTAWSIDSGNKVLICQSNKDDFCPKN